MIPLDLDDGVHICLNVLLEVVKIIHCRFVVTGEVGTAFLTLQQARPSTVS